MAVIVDQLTHMHIHGKIENCIIEELHTAPVKMIQMDRKYYIVREYETEPETTKAVIRRAQPFNGPRNTSIFQIHNNRQSICDSK